MGLSPKSCIIYHLAHWVQIVIWIFYSVADSNWATNLTLQYLKIVFTRRLSSKVKGQVKHLFKAKKVSTWYIDDNIIPHKRLVFHAWHLYTLYYHIFAYNLNTNRQLINRNLPYIYSLRLFLYNWRPLSMSFIRKCAMYLLCMCFLSKTNPTGVSNRPFRCFRFLNLEAYQVQLSSRNNPTPGTSRSL